MASSVARPVAFSAHFSHLNKSPTFGLSSASVRLKCDPCNLSHHLNTSLDHPKNASSTRAIRAQILPEYVPDAKFYKIEAILRPWRVPLVSSALLKMGIRGVTVSDVRGFGAQGGMKERQGGSEFSEDNFLGKTKMEIVVCKEQVEQVIDKIVSEARTGELGDGKIFLIPVSDVIRVRTGERGEKAERMIGGFADMNSSVVG